MAGKRNGRLECIHASNPYHICSEYCTEKKGDSQRQIFRKDSGDGGSKYSTERKKTVRSDCINGSNPYHDCNEFCSIRTTQTGRPNVERDSGSGVAKKESRPKPPRELDVPLAGTFSPKPPVAKPRVTPEEKIDSRNGVFIRPYEGETFVDEDSLSIGEMNKFSQLILVSPNALKAEYHRQRPRITDASSSTSMKSKEDIKLSPDEISVSVQDLSFHDDDDDEGDHKSKTASQNITSFPFPALARNHEDSDEDEIKSSSSEPSVPIGNYFVKESLAPILQSIFNKHGDIAASCKLESISIRSYYLECVCYIIQELQSSNFSQKMSKPKVKELLAILKDVESSEMNAGWLHSILNDVAEVVESNSQQWTLEAAKASCDHELDLTKKELESQMEHLKLKEKEMSDAKEKVADTKARLSELEFKYFQLNEEISSMQLKINNLKSNILTDGLV